MYGLVCKRFSVQNLPQHRKEERWHGKECVLNLNSSIGTNENIERNERHWKYINLLVSCLVSFISGFGWRSMFFDWTFILCSENFRDQGSPGSPGTQMLVIAMFVELCPHCRIVRFAHWPNPGPLGPLGPWGRSRKLTALGHWPRHMPPASWHWRLCGQSTLPHDRLGWEKTNNNPAQPELEVMNCMVFA